MVPVGKRLFRPLHEIENFTTGEATGRVVIRLVAGLLKFDECARNSKEFRLQRSAIQPGRELWRHAVIGELLGDLSHCGVTERSRQTVAQSGSVSARQHQSRRVIDKQVKECVVGCRDRPSQARLQWAPRLLDGELSGLPQQVVMQAHDACSTSEAPRK